MKQVSNIRLWRRGRCCALGMAVAGAMGTAHTAKADVVFNDTFSNGSTVDNSATLPSSNATDYAVLSAKTATGTISSGSYALSQTASGSAITETQAQFTSSPVTLSAGEQMDLIVTFTDTGGILVTGSSTSAQLDFGLFNSGGSAPLTSLSNAGLNSSNSSSGGALGWVGYSSQTYFTGSGTGSRIVTRPVQTTDTANNQDVLLDGASSSSSYTGPSGSQVGANNAAGAVTLTAGSVYTDDLTILADANGDGGETISNNLYSGSGVNAANLISSDVGASTVATSNFETASFDSLAIGWRDTFSTTPTELTFSQIEVTTTAASTPEPASLGLVALAGTMMLRRRR